jgi:hypothetical protein
LQAEANCAAKGLKVTPGRRHTVLSEPSEVPVLSTDPVDRAVDIAVDIAVDNFVD